MECQRLDIGGREPEGASRGRLGNAPTWDAAFCSQSDRGNWLSSAKRTTIRNRRKRSGSARQTIGLLRILMFSSF